MLTVKSKTEKNKRYFFESGTFIKPDDFNEGRLVGVRSDLEKTLTLSSENPPIEQKDHDALKEIMQDCVRPELKACYEDSYSCLMGYLKLMGVVEDHTNTYNIHTCRVIE